MGATDAVVTVFVADAVAVVVVYVVVVAVATVEVIVAVNVDGVSSLVGVISISDSKHGPSGPSTVWRANSTCSVVLVPDRTSSMLALPITCKCSCSGTMESVMMLRRQGIVHGPFSLSLSLPLSLSFFVFFFFTYQNLEN